MSFITDLVGFLNGFRKLSVMLLIISAGVAFRITDHINGAEFVDLLKNTVIAFFSFNGIEHVTKTATEWLKKKATKEDVIGAVKEAMGDKKVEK